MIVVDTAVRSLEIAQVLRRYCAAGDLDAGRGAEALQYRQPDRREASLQEFIR